MNFLITSFIYPFPEPILLSKHLKFYLDNPRTDEEVAYVKELLLNAYESRESYRFPVHSEEPVITLEQILFDFREGWAGVDEYVANHFKSYGREAVFDFIAKMWVVARYDDEGEIELIKEETRQMREAGQAAFVMLESEHPIVKNSHKLASYSYLLSLLANSEGEEYYGRGIILNPNRSDSSRSISWMWRHFLMFGITCQDGLGENESGAINDPLRWMFLPYALIDIKEAAHLLDKAFEDGLEEKLLYIGSILKVVSADTRDEKVMLVMLTSIIELLLTHNPNFNRFNVEDSINKQFQLKASILVYLKDKSRDIRAIQKQLKKIYEQRSNIAHGNFDATHKFIRNLSKVEGEEEYFSDMLTALYSYIRDILEYYLEERAFVDFLKDN